MAGRILTNVRCIESVYPGPPNFRCDTSPGEFLQAKPLVCEGPNACNDCPGGPQDPFRVTGATSGTEPCAGYNQCYTFSGTCSTTGTDCAWVFSGPISFDFFGGTDTVRVIIRFEPADGKWYARAMVTSRVHYGSGSAGAADGCPGGFTTEGGGWKDITASGISCVSGKLTFTSFTLSYIGPVGECGGTITVTSAPNCNDTPGSCPCDPSPCTSGGGVELKSSYAIQGYTDSLFSLPAPCTGCTNSGATAWDGSFTHVTSAPCKWSVGGGTITPLRSINGKQLCSNCTFIDHTGAGGGKWELIVVCRSSNEIVWKGENTTSENPTGTYVRTLGCSTLGSLVVI
jgi:hypothetical protein